MKLDKNYKVRVTPEQSREIHSLILLEGGEVSYGLKPQLQDEFLVVENEHDSVVIYYTDQDIFPTIENQEIQADDLIALLTDLLKSAENPLQDMELTPETEASETKFKVGDKVYFGTDPDIKTISEVGNDNDVQFAGEFGWASGYSCCHANQENYERLQATFTDIEFERPPKELKGSDLARAMLERGDRRIYGYASDNSDNDPHGYECVVRDYDVNNGFGVIMSDGRYEFFIPCDLRTGELLTESVLDE